MTQKGNGRSTPVVDEQVETPVFIQIAGHTTHWRHRGRVVRQRAEIEAARNMASACSRSWSNDDHVLSGVDVADVVGQTVAVEIAEGSGCTDGRDPGSDIFQFRMDVSNLLWSVSGP